jgi:hypothetical protein
MHLLPSDFPLNAYVGCVVAQVVEAPHQVEIALVGNPEKAWIHFEGPAVLHSPDGMQQRFENAALLQGNGAFNTLHRSTIKRVHRLSDASCKFSFSNGYALSLLAEVPGYESYHLGVAGSFCDV